MATAVKTSTRPVAGVATVRSTGVCADATQAEVMRMAEETAAYLRVRMISRPDER